MDGFGKHFLRTDVLAARRAMSHVDRQAANAHLRGHLVAALARYAPRTVAAYVPLATEPGGTDLPEWLRQRGLGVMLPVFALGEPLRWTSYTGQSNLAPGPAGLTEPVGERLPPAALSLAQLVIVPALAVDLRGNRLGKGAGAYDRILSLAVAPTVALLFDGELRDELPAEPHDRPVRAAITPSLGLRELGLALGHPECQSS